MKKLILTISMALSLFVSANAAMIHIGDDIGQPADIGSELARLEQSITSWNILNDPNLPLPTSMGWTGTQTQTPDGGTSVTLDLNNFVGYLLLKWGNQNCFYYINDNDPTPALSYLNAYVENDGLYTFNSDAVANILNVSYGGGHVAQSTGPNLGLSHYTTFATVPEPAETGLLMGFALCGVFLFHRKVKQSA